MTSDCLLPKCTLAAIHGPGHVYISRASPTASTWLTRDPATLDAMTGGAIPVAGDMPILCARGAATEQGLSLLRDAGVPVATHLWRFAGVEDYLMQLQRLAAAGWRTVMQHWHPPAELAETSWSVPPALLSRLNNKANLAQFVPPGHVLPRITIPAADLMKIAARIPCVVKAGTNESTGGGDDVYICRSLADLKAADDYFARSCTLVVEKFSHFQKNLCVNYVVFADGTVVYLGTAEQVSDADGKYHGNWIEEPVAGEDIAVDLGRAIAEKGAALGYRGCLGIDMGVLNNGEVMVFDLNFRLNGSTAALLLYPAVVRRYGHRIVRLKSVSSPRPFRELLNAAHQAVEQGWFVPISSYDPQAGNYPRASARMVGLFLGASRDEVEEREKEFAALSA
jgi:hypothetical protein